ncbi:MAG: SDR family NAD(P)-dependent oxidoreductase [Rhodoluna sp.]|nr:SDR family NAD(P)-dependent oxidoreductase [Rhodoluna sp.]
MRIVVISATSTIARACVAHWANAGSHEFLLVGRSQARLKATESDFAIRFQNSKFSSLELDFHSSSDVQKLIDLLAKKPVDLALVAQGSLTEQAEASKELGYLKQQLELNVISAALFAEGLAGLFERQGFGTLGVIGSVAGDRGRAYNYSYGSSKAFLETYAQGLQQRFAKAKVRVSLIKPGPTATPMTSTHKGKLADPVDVAKVIVAGLAKGRRTIYAPKLWRLIMFVVRAIPFFIFKRLNF